MQLVLSEPGKRAELRASLTGALLRCKEWKRAEQQLLQALGEADQPAVPLLRQLVNVQVLVLLPGVVVDMAMQALHSRMFHAHAHESHPRPAQFIDVAMQAMHA